MSAFQRRCLCTYGVRGELFSKSGVSKLGVRASQSPPWNKKCSYVCPKPSKNSTFDVCPSVFPNQFNIAEASSIVLQKLEGPDEKHPQQVIYLAETSCSSKRFTAGYCSPSCCKVFSAVCKELIAAAAMSPSLISGLWRLWPDWQMRSLVEQELC